MTAHMLWARRLLYAFTTLVARQHYNECQDWHTHDLNSHLEKWDVWNDRPEWAKQTEE